MSAHRPRWDYGGSSMPSLGMSDAKLERIAVIVTHGVGRLNQDNAQLVSCRRWAKSRASSSSPRLRCYCFRTGQGWMDLRLMRAKSVQQPTQFKHSQSYCGTPRFKSVCS